MDNDYVGHCSICWLSGTNINKGLFIQVEPQCSIIIFVFPGLATNTAVVVFSYLSIRIIFAR